jgi:hypothetical protein
MKYSKDDLDKLTPQEALSIIQKEPLTGKVADTTLMYSAKTARTFEDFQKTLLIIEPALLDNIGCYDKEMIGQV